MYRIVIAVDKKGLCVEDAESADNLLFIDLDTSEKILVENPLKKNRVDSMEILLEEYNPAVYFCRKISDNNRLVFEENGVKVLTVADNSIEDILEYIGVYADDSSKHNA